MEHEAYKLSIPHVEIDVKNRILNIQGKRFFVHNSITPKTKQISKYEFNVGCILPLKNVYHGWGLSWYSQPLPMAKAEKLATAAFEAIEYLNSLLLRVNRGETLITGKNNHVYGHEAAEMARMANPSYAGKSDLETLQLELARWNLLGDGHEITLKMIHDDLDPLLDAKQEIDAALAELKAKGWNDRG
jgi:hypothetical protein